MTIAALIAPLLEHRAFISYRLAPLYDRHGNRLPKDNKIPTCPRTGQDIDAHDQRYWLTGREILETRMPVAIVLHEALNVFCIDLDGAATADGWSEFSQGICRAFPGAAIEISTSGRGLHIFAMCNNALIPPHRTSKDTVPGLEIYTRKRFIALTGTSLQGDIRVDHTAMLQACIAHYFPEPPISSDHWTTQAVVKGPGIELSDDAMLNWLMDSRAGARAAFLNGATFSELWNADKNALAIAFPTNEQGKEWDYSRADMALINHLLYATGCNCERVLNLLQGCPLYRAKWDREDYLRRTIGRAVVGKIRDAQPLGTQPVAPPVPAPIEAPAVVPPVPAPPPSGERKPPGTHLGMHDQRVMFAGCTYVRDIHRILTPDGRSMTQQQFNVEFGGYDFAMTIDGARPTRSAWDAFTQSQLYSFPKAEGLYFDPLEAPLQPRMRDGQVFVNSYFPIETPRVRGDVTVFLDHLARVLPQPLDQQILLAYMAFIVQNKGRKAAWAPLLQGVEGNGKTFMSQALTFCIGRRYTHWPLAKNVGNTFNKGFDGMILVCVEDLKVSESKAEVWEAIKVMITGTVLEITPKGVDGITKDICFNFMLNSNHKDAIRKTRNDRRVCPFFCAQQHVNDLARYGMNNPNYYNHLYGWAEHAQGYAMINDFLCNYQIPDELHPLKGARRAPETSSTENAIRAGRGMIEQEIVEAIEEGRPGFRDGWISMTAVENLLVQLGKSRALTREQKHEMLMTMGYWLHPELPEGRPVEPLSDGTRPRLYITREGHPTERRNLTPQQIAACYVASQSMQLRVA